MPIYEYECLSCGVRFELRRSMADSDKNARCPECGAEDAERILSKFATSSVGDSCAPGAST